MKNINYEKYICEIKKLTNLIAIFEYWRIENDNLCFFSIIKDCDKNIEKKVINFTLDFFIENDLHLDFKIPYNNRFVYTLSEIKEIFLAYSFSYENWSFYIPEVTFDPAFVSSKSFKYRLFLNAIICWWKLIYWNKKFYDKILLKSWETILFVILSNVNYTPCSINDILELLIKRKIDWINLLYNKRELLNNLNKWISLFKEKSIISINNEKYIINNLFVNDFIEKHNKIKSKIEKEEIWFFIQDSTYLDFSQNTNPFWPPFNILDIINTLTSNIKEYPDYTNDLCNQELSRFIKVNKKNVSIIQWSLEAIYYLPNILKSKNALIIIPTYWWYLASLTKNWIKTEKFSLNDDLSINIDKFKKSLEWKDLVFICNPNNPTSTYLEFDIINRIVKENPATHFIIDESHLLLKESFYNNTMSKNIEIYNNLSIIYSLSKFFNIPWLRVWALVSNSYIIDKFKKYWVPYYINTISQTLLIKALSEKKFIERTRKKLNLLICDFYEKLKEIKDLKVYKSQCNFFLCKILNKKTNSIKVWKILKSNATL
jgi:threonine-phosphate decarboxylase